MRIQSAISVIALVFGLIAGPAFAQSLTIGGEVVADADVAAVQARCDELKLASEGSISESTEQTTDEVTDEDGAVVEEDEGASSDEPEVNGMDQALATIDLETITLADCEAGGWITQ